MSTAPHCSVSIEVRKRDFVQTFPAPDDAPDSETTCKIVGTSAPTLRKQMSEGRFPKCYRLAGRHYHFRPDLKAHDAAEIARLTEQVAA